MKKKKAKRDLYTVWSCVSSVPGWLRLLWLTKEYTEAELDELERIDDEFLRIAREEKIKWRKWLREELPKTPQGWLKIFPEAKHLVKPLTQKQTMLEEQLEVARNAELEEIVEQYIDLRRSGFGRLVGLCPFHKEKTPSFMVYTNDNHFFCYGCQEHGDAIKFIRHVEKLTFKEAVTTLYEYSRQN